MKNNGLYNPESYDGIPSIFFLEGYEIKDGCMYVSMLDGFKLQVPYSKELEEETLKVMQEQAELRNSHSQELLKAGKVRVVTKSLGMVFEGILAAYWISESIKDRGALNIIMASVISLFSFSFAHDIQKALDDMKDIRKFKLYLDFSQLPDFENLQGDPRIFEGVNSGDVTLNINTVDKFSLSEIETIAGNVRKLTKPNNNK